MEKNRIININNHSLIFGIIGYVLICIRYYFIHVISDSITLTIIINIFAVLAFDYSKLEKSIFYILPLVLLIPFNHSILGIIDIGIYTILLKKIHIRFLSTLNIVIAITSLIITLYLIEIGILKNNIEIVRKGIISDGGFGNPNSFAMIVYSLCVSLYIIWQRRINLLQLSLILLIGIATYAFTGSRTYYIGFITITILGVLPHLNINILKIKFLLKLLPVTIFILIISISQNQSLSTLFDIYFSGRFYIYNSIITQMSPINWLIGIKTPEDIPMDGSYLNILFSGGIYSLFLFFIIYIDSINSTNTKLKGYLPLILSIVICGIAENTFSAPSPLSIMFFVILLNLIERNNYAI